MLSEKKLYSDQGAYGTPMARRKALASCDLQQVPYIFDLPFDCAGKGEQCRVQMRLAIAGAEQSKVLLIEEPENHLSHSNLNMFMDDIRKDCADRQVFITTHSAFVLNKLGIDSLRLISLAGKTAELTELTSDTKNYFMKLPGYDTLRLILSKRRPCSSYWSNSIHRPTMPSLVGHTTTARRLPLLAISTASTT